ncbi:glycerol-3-phosphate O-acyltransferase [Schizosaccharomyces octosporus yFS286]|uniref:Glycerol-3-phosphate O-acyltransferase n=1 Tax=Schizosaccharomyces octosporus (strain yFS286) TaxID=483514 RepID=S9PPB6_SCHOY|nr:glycerol-3-phosphate O-acyltransferase [Schizosaccharomyces octosporus yFS286]EPX71056.1 glycerol-3-phosphate O-acyltransferase [Schizosaccharomyces octosporus yFS286]
MNYPFVYDTILWILSILIDFFFREVKTRGAFRVPRKGPIILVAAPHANQFVDPLILMLQLRREVNRRTSTLVAAKSHRQKIIGIFSRAFGAIPVERAQDLAKRGKGKIYVVPDGDQSEIHGIDTEFTNHRLGDTIILPNNSGSTHIASIESDTLIRVKREFREEAAVRMLHSPEGCTYKVAPEVNQATVFDKVRQRLVEGACIAIFPEGGSHDRPEMLPLKAGVAIMALETLSQNPDCGLQIVSCGMNYFHPHRFRSRAVLEFGSPLSIPEKDVQLYKDGKRREAIQNVLDMIYGSLLSVTVQTPDYETLMVIQACRRLYKPAHVQLSLPKVVDLNRKLITGYNHFKKDPRVIRLHDRILLYNRQLYRLGIRDHQVQGLRYSRLLILYKLVYSCCKLFLLALGALPGAILFSPVFIAAKRISVRKAEEALRGSSVKIQGRDILATWKLLVALGMTPILYSFYAMLCCYFIYSYKLIPHSSIFVYAIPIISSILFPMVTYAALRFGEVAVDIYKSIRPLFLALIPSKANAVYILQHEREELVAEVTDVINKLGPELFPDFDVHRLVPERQEHPSRYTRRLSSSVESDVDNLSQLHETEMNQEALIPSQGDVYLYSPYPHEMTSSSTDEETENHNKAYLIRKALRERMGLRMSQKNDSRDFTPDGVFSESDDQLSD